MRLLWLLIFSTLAWPLFAQEDTLFDDTISMLEQTRGELVAARTRLVEATEDPNLLVLPQGDGYSVVDVERYMVGLRQAAILAVLAADVPGADRHRAIEVSALILGVPARLVTLVLDFYDPRFETDETARRRLMTTLGEFQILQMDALRAIHANLTERITAIDDHLDLIRDERARHLAREAEPATLPDRAGGYDVPAARGGWLYDGVTVLGSTNGCGGGRGCCYEYRDPPPPAGVAYYSVDETCFTCTAPYGFGIRGAHEYPTCWVHSSRVE